jgi:hypothetical protein
VGRDNISDFTTALIKWYLLEYTQTFALKYVRPGLRKPFVIEKVRFNYDTESWVRDTFVLPTYGSDFVILTPKDMLTKDDTWISRGDLLNHFDGIAQALPNETLRDLVNNHFRRMLPRNPKADDIQQARVLTIQAYPELIEHYIKEKEENGDEAESVSSLKVKETEQLFIRQVQNLVAVLSDQTAFYASVGNTYDESRKRVEFLKDVIENKDGYRLFWPGGQPIRREEDVQLLYRLTWFATPSDVNREVNNGRGPVDFKVSRGAADKSLVEFKLGSNSKLKQNLANQVEIYQKASEAKRALKVITYFKADELAKIQRILKELNMIGCEDIILIDAREDNKPSASNA